MNSFVVVVVVLLLLLLHPPSFPLTTTTTAVTPSTIRLLGFLTIQFVVVVPLVSLPLLIIGFAEWKRAAGVIMALQLVNTVSSVSGSSSSSSSSSSGGGGGGGGGLLAAKKG